MGKTNHMMVVRNALFIYLIIYFVNNFLIVHAYDVSALFCNVESLSKKLLMKFVACMSEMLELQEYP